MKQKYTLNNLKKKKNQLLRGYQKLLQSNCVRTNSRIFSILFLIIIASLDHLSIDLSISNTYTHIMLSMHMCVSNL